jgi:hypothetical protein
MSSKPTNQISNLDIHQINIMVMGDPSKEPVPFTLNMLYHPTLQKSANLSPLPYITHKVKLPYKILYGMNYNKLVSFFFNKQIFKSLLNKRENIQEEEEEDSSETKIETEEEEIEKKERNNHKILNYNVQLMMKLLFPTEWPSKDNFVTSFNERIQQKLPDISFKNVFNKSIITSTFSYLLLNGEKYTVVKSTWLNDIYNHPTYFDFMEEFNKFIEWRRHVEEDKIIENKINKNMEALEVLYTSKSESLNVFFNTIKETKYSGTRKKFKELINKFINTKIQIENIRELYRLITDINNIIKEINLHKENRIFISSSIDTAIQLLTKNINEIYYLNEIFEEYIKKGTIQSLKNEQPGVIELLKKDYPQYITFTEKIQNLIPNKRKSSNYDLQTFIEKLDYGLLKELYEYQKINSSNINVYNTGVTYVHLEEDNDVKYEIYVSFDLIEGEYDTSTMNEFKCKFEGFYLGSNFDHLFNKQYKNIDYRSNKFFLTKDELKQFDDKKLKKKGGYKKQSRKTKKYIKKTRKAY